MKVKTLAASVLLSGAILFAGGAGEVSAQCIPEAVNASDFTVNGVFDVNAYLAAVQAANAACSPVGNLPDTGGGSSFLLPLALGFVAVGGASIATANVRRRSTTS